LKDFTEILVSPERPILEVLQIIDRTARQIALVVDGNNHLLGTVTDGDVRRGLLRGVQLSDPVKQVMNPHPRTLAGNTDYTSALRGLRERGIVRVPLVDGDGRVIGLEEIDSPAAGAGQDALVVLMAGGRGSRLYPLTEHVPKPLLPVGGRPLLETTINLIAGQGFRRFLLCLNFKSDMIRNHFGDGKQLGIEIEYVEERSQLGTAGALSLIESRPQTPIIVMNGDIMTTANFNRLVDFHKEHGAAATVCLREYSFQIPYGVVEVENDRLVGFTEKPTHKSFVSAGIYVLESSVLGLLKRGDHCDMPELIQRVGRTMGAPTAYLLREYWLDIGRLDDLSKAQDDFAEVFG
jgi:dTDP-glucose pyrophosphorylase